MDSAAMVLLPEVQRAIKTEAFQAWAFLRRFGFELDDLCQEFMVHLLSRLNRYDNGRASLATFARRTCRNKALQLLEKASAAKRNPGGTPQSLSAPLEDEEGGADELCDTISEDEYNIRMGRRSRPAAELLALQIDTQRAMARLPNELAELANLLVEEPVAEVARMLSFSRSTEARRRTRIRSVFVDAGLLGYVAGEEAA